MPTINERLETATASLESDSAKAHDIVNGPASGAGSTVSTDNGPVKTFANIVAAGEAALAAAVGDLEESASASATQAGNFATAAGQSEYNASVSAVEAAASATASSDSATASAGSATAAAGSATTAGNAATAAGVSQTAAATSATAAATSATNAGNSATAAGVSQTAAAASAAAALASQNAAAASQVGAAASATSAAASAVLAQQAIAASFKGSLAGATVPATSTTAGDWYRITSAGTSQGKTWAIGDMAIYNGTSGAWTQIPGSLIAEDRVLAGDARRALAPAFYFDGETTAARGYLPLSTAGDGIGAAGGKFTQHLWAMWETVITDVRCLWNFSALSTGTNTANNALRLYIHGSAGGVARIEIGDSVPTNRRYFSTVAEVAAARAGLWTLFSVTHDGSAAQPLLYINGVLQAVTVDNTAGGAVPNWNSGFADDFFVLGNYQADTYRFKGRMRFLPPINRVQSAAEILAYAQTSRLPVSDELATGSMVAHYASNFSAGSDSWTQNVGDANLVLTGNVDAIASVDDVLEILASGGNKTFQIVRTNTLVGVGRRYSITLDYYAEVGATTGSPFLGIGTASLREDLAGIAIVEGSWQLSKTLEFIAAPTISQRLALFTTVSGVTAAQLLSGKKIYFKNINVRPLGPIARSVVQPGTRCFADLGSNKLPGYFTTGITPLADTDTGKYTQNALTANGELLDTGGVIVTDATLVDVIVKNTSANIVYGFALGMVSGGEALTHRTDIPAGATVIVPIRRSDLAGLTVGSSPYGRIYYSANSWNSGSLNLAIRYRRENDI
jgi:hypothetical protein